MKISNIIVITFFTLIVGVILAMFIYGRVGEKSERKDKSTFSTKTFSLPEFGVIVAEPEVNLNVNRGNQKSVSVNGQKVDLNADNRNDQNSFQIFYSNDEQPSENQDDYFRVSNDTLYVFYKYKQCNIIVKSDSLSVLAVDSKIFIGFLALEKMKISVEQSTVDLHNVNCNGDMSIAGNNSRINYHSGTINKLHIMLDKSKLDYYSGNIGQLSIQLRNESRSDFRRRPDVLQLDKDTSSDFRFY